MKGKMIAWFKGSSQKTSFDAANTLTVLENVQIKLVNHFYFLCLHIIQ